MIAKVFFIVLSCLVLAGCAKTKTDLTPAEIYKLAGVSPPNPRVSKAVLALWDEQRRAGESPFVRPESSRARTEEWYRRLGKLLDTRHSEGLTDVQFADDVFRSCFVLDDMAGGYFMISLPEYTVSSPYGLSAMDWMEAIAPYVDGPPANIMTELASTAVPYMLKSAGAFDLERNDEDHSFELPTLQKYTLTNPPADHPNLINLYFTLHPAETFNTLAKQFITKKEQPDVFREYAEWKLALAVRDLANGEEKVAAAKDAVIAKLKAMSNSPHWCVRAYVAAMCHRPEYAYGGDETVRERLAKDEHPVVARVAKELQ